MIKDALEIFGMVIDKFVTNKDDRAAAKEGLESLNASGDLELLKGGQEIAKAEAGSEDKWTSRARPSFLYLMYGYFALAPVFAIFFMIWPDRSRLAVEGMELFLAAIPDPMWLTFAACFSVYTGARTIDKRARTVLWQKFLGKTQDSSEALRKIREKLSA